MNGSLRQYNTGTKLAEWGERVAACRSSGMEVTAWCAKEGVSTRQYYYWQKKLFTAAQEQPEFVEVPAVEDRAGSIATIRAKGLEVEIHSGADRETLRALLEALRRC